MENPIKMDDLGVPLFSETPIHMMHEASRMKSGIAAPGVQRSKINPLEDGIFCSKWGYFIYLLAMLCFLECISTIKMNVDKKTSKFFRLEALCW